jgi:hypothetical protein
MQARLMARSDLPVPVEAETWCPIPGAGRDDLLPFSSALRAASCSCAASSVSQRHDAGDRAARRDNGVSSRMDDQAGSCSRRDSGGAALSACRTAGSAPGRRCRPIVAVRLRERRSACYTLSAQRELFPRETAKTSLPPAVIERLVLLVGQLLTETAAVELAVI